MRYLADIEIYGCPYCGQKHFHDPYDCEHTYQSPDTWLIHQLCRTLLGLYEEPERIVFGRRAA